MADYPFCCSAARLGSEQSLTHPRARRKWGRLRQLLSPQRCPAEFATALRQWKRQQLACQQFLFLLRVLLLSQQAWAKFLLLLLLAVLPDCLNGRLLTLGHWSKAWCLWQREPVVPMRRRVSRRVGSELGPPTVTWGQGSIARWLLHSPCEHAGDWRFSALVWHVIPEGRAPVWHQPNT